MWEEGKRRRTGGKIWSRGNEVEEKRERKRGRKKERERGREGGGRRERNGLIIHIIREWSPENCSCGVADRLR